MKPLNCNINDCRSTEISNNRLTNRRRHFTTPNRLPDSVIPEEEDPQFENLLDEQKNNQPQSNQQNKNNQENDLTTDCCCRSQILVCSAHFHRLPDLIIQHQPVIMSSDVHFEKQKQIDNLTSKLALVYTPHWIDENDVFLPSNHSFSNFNQLNNGHKNNEDNKQNQLNLCSPKIVRCQLSSSALYQCNKQRLKAKLLAAKSTRSVSVSFPIDHETLRQVGYSLRMISEQFHLKRLQANSKAKNEQNNVTHLIKWFCKLVVNKLPSISWKSNNNNNNDETDTELRNNTIKINSVTNNRLINKNLNKDHNLRIQPDIIPMVHLVIPVRQRCHSTTTDC